MVFTRQVPDGATMGLRNEVIAAGAATGEGVVLGASATIGTPAVRPAGSSPGPGAGGVAVVAVR